MSESSWNWQRTSLWVTILMVLILAAVPLLELTRPGVVICPLRRAAKKVGLPTRGLDELLASTVSPEDERWAKSMAEEWKQSALKLYPNLRVESHPVAEKQNGFWQICKLDNFSPQPTTSLLDIQRDLSVLDSAKATEALARNKAWVNQVEWLTSLDQTSSMELPDGPVVFMPARPCKQAHDTLMLMAVLAAEAGDEAEALRCIRAGGRLGRHLSQIETPTLLSETVHVLCQLNRASLIIEKILPALGADAKLEQWQQEIDRVEFTPQDLARAVRGEWQVGSGNLVYPALALAHRQRMLIDPEGVAMAHARMASEEFDALMTMTVATMARAKPSPTLPKDLSPEGREMMGMIGVGSEVWLKGYTRSARVMDCLQAAMELLALERTEGELQAHDTKRVTPDPVTGSPFILDPKTRKLTMPPGYPEFEMHEPLKLPW